MPPPDPSLVEVLLTAHTAYGDLAAIRVDPRATCGEVSDDVHRFRAWMSQVSEKARDIMPQTVFRDGFWRRVIEFAGSVEATSAFGRIAGEHGVPDGWIRGDFFEAVVVACQEIQTEPLPRAPRVDTELGRVGQMWDLALQPFRPAVTAERTAVTVRNERIAWITYSRRRGRVVVDSIRRSMD